MTQADKERIRRAEIEAAYVHPNPVTPWHDAELDETPTTCRAIVAALEARGATISAKAAVVYPLPSWSRQSPDDALLSYYSTPTPSYHLKAYFESELPRMVNAVDVQYVGGKPIKSRVGLGRVGKAGSYRMISVSSVAKWIREQS